MKSNVSVLSGQDHRQSAWDAYGAPQFRVSSVKFLNNLSIPLKQNQYERRNTHRSHRSIKWWDHG